MNLHRIALAALFIIHYSFFIIHSSAQTTINGNLPDLNGMTVQLMSHGKAVDSVLVENGNLHLTMRDIDEPNYVTLVSTDNRFMTMFWIAKDDNVTLSFSDDKKQCIVKGSQTEDEYQEFSKVMQPVYAHKLSIKKQQTQALKEGRQDISDALNDSIRRINTNEYYPRLVQFAKDHPRSYISLNFIYNSRVLDKVPYTQYSKHLALLDPTAFHGYQWDVINQKLKSDRKLEPGATFEDYEGVDYYGNKVTTADCRGKYLFFTISQTALKEYTDDIPARKALKEKFGDRLEFIDAFFCGDKADLLKVVAQHKLKWKAISDFKAWDGKWAKSHGIDHLGRNVLVSPDGKVLANDLFGDNMVKTIKKFVK